MKGGPFSLVEVGCGAQDDGFYTFPDMRATWRRGSMMLQIVTQHTMAATTASATELQSISASTMSISYGWSSPIMFIHLYVIPFPLSSGRVAGVGG